jgi:FixJ family two-component response regulator
MLGHETGLHLSEQMVKIRPGLRFIMISSITSANLATTALHNSMLDFIEKPINSATLIEKVKTSLQYIYIMREQEAASKKTVEELRRYKEKYGELK